MTQRSGAISARLRDWFATPPEGLQPTFVGAIEMADRDRVEVSIPVRPDGAEGCSRARFLVRDMGTTLGFATVAVIDGTIDRDELDRQLTELRSSSPPAVATVAEVPSVSVVVTTNRRTELARRLVGQVLDQSLTPSEVILVDSGGSITRDDPLLSDDRAPVRLISVAAHGHCYSRNIGARAATGEVVVFSNDDLVVEDDWLERLVAGLLTQDRAMLSTGLTIPLQLEEPAQILFELAFNWSAKQGLEPHVIRPPGPGVDPLVPYRVGDFASCGSMLAIRRSDFERIGGFAEDLGVGTPSRAGDDLDFGSRVLLAGGSIAIAPSSVAWHDDDLTLDGLPKKMFDYGVGLTSFLTRHALDPTTRPTLLRKIPAGLGLFVRQPWNVQGQTSIEADPVPIPRRLGLLQTAGRLWGPVRYLQARRRLEQLERDDVLATGSKDEVCRRSLT